MDDISLLSALTAACESAAQADDEGRELIRMLHQAADEPSHADQRLVMLLEQLRRTPELEIFNEKMEGLAIWLLSRAAKVGGEQTLDNLHQFLTASEVPYRKILALGGIALDFSCTLGHNITLLPWNELPDTMRKSRVHVFLPRRLLIPLWPTAALVRDITLPRRYVAQAEWPQVEHNLTPVDYTDLKDALLCIGLVGPVAPYEFLTWLEPAEWAPILDVTLGLTYPRGFTLGLPFPGENSSRNQWAQDAAVQARELYERFAQLSESLKDLMRLRMQRLNSAMRRLDLVDAAIDLGITLESLFLNDTEEELSFRLKLRAARLLRQDYDDRVHVFNLVNDLYTIRSAAVHSGHIPTTKKFRKRLRSPYKSGTTEDLLKAGFALAAQAIAVLLQTGESQQDWLKITLA